MLISRGLILCLSMRIMLHYEKKRVKYPKLTAWLTKDVTEATAARDRLNKGNKFKDCKNNKSETE